LKGKKSILLIIKLLVSFFLLYTLISRVGYKTILDSVKGISPLIVISSSVIYIIATYVSAVRWRLLTFSKLPTRKLFILYMIGSFFNTILPGIIGGDAVKAYYLYRETGNPGISMASVFMDRYVGFISLMLIALLALPFGLTYIKGTEIEYLFPTVVIAFVAGSIGFFRLRVGSGVKILREFYSFFDAYKKIKETSPVIIKTLLLSGIIQLMGMFSVYLITAGLNAPVPLLSILLFIPIIVTVSMLPLSISGLGIREAGFVILFGKIGIRPEVAMSISLLWFISVVLGSLPGLLFYVLYLKKDHAPQVVK
jgi:uncharacterized membrane protein YbhN (UPF0104 family)